MHQQIVLKIDKKVLYNTSSNCRADPVKMGNFASNYENELLILYI